MKIRQIVKERLDAVFGVDNYRLITVAITGSHAYGMQTDKSDRDIMGIYLQPDRYLLGMNNRKAINGKNVEAVKVDKTGDVEGMLFSFSKWYQMAYEQNPNVLELLWHTHTQYVYKDSVIWPMLIANRDNLISKEMKHSFVGYAYAQMERLNKIDENENKNGDRLAEFKKFGYSTKNAATMMRLLNTVFDTLVDKEVRVMRPERHLLMSIRQGKYKYDDIIKMANEKIDRIEEAYMRSDLRNTVDYDFANQLHIDILKKHLEIK